MTDKGIRIFGGSSNPGFVTGICDYLRGERDVKIYPAEIKRETFSDGEPRIEILENIRETDVFIIQSTCKTPDNVAEENFRVKFPDKSIPEGGIRGYSQSENLMELLLMIDAAVRSSARRVTAVMPYYGFGRQDKKNHS